MLVVSKLKCPEAKKVILKKEPRIYDALNKISFVCCCCFMSWQHVRSYQDEYRLVTVGTHGDFTVQAVSAMT